MAIIITAPSVYIKPIYRVPARTRRLLRIGDTRNIIGHHWVYLTNKVSNWNCDYVPGDNASVNHGDTMRVIAVYVDTVKVRLFTIKPAFGAAAPTGSEFIVTHEDFLNGRARKLP